MINFFDKNQSLWKYIFKGLLSGVNIEIYLKGNFNINEIPKKSEFFESMLHTLKKIKTFGISQVLYLCSVFKVPDRAMSEITNVMYEFLWNSKQNKVKSKVIIQNIKHGGFNMYDMESKFKRQQLKWVIHFFDKNQSLWKHTFKSYLSVENIEIYLKGNFNINEIPKKI